MIAAPAAGVTAAEPVPLFPQITAGVATLADMSPAQMIAVSPSELVNPQPKLPSPFGVWIGTSRARP